MAALFAFNSKRPSSLATSLLRKYALSLKNTRAYYLQSEEPSMAPGFPVAFRRWPSWPNTALHLSIDSDGF